MDTSDPNIKFDEKGVCERCNTYYNSILPDWNNGNGHEKELNDLLQKIKETGKGKPYDCLFGFSGGLDSSFLLHMAIKEWKLRPLVFHIDAGFDLPFCTNNIRRQTEKLGIDLKVEVVDFEDVKNFQIALFRTGLAGALDLAQDHAFVSILDEYAVKNNIKYIINMKRKVLLVFGTRPEAIKMAPLVKEFQRYSEKFTTVICVTGQHREMLDQVLNIFEIIPDYDLNIMKQGQDLYDVTSRILIGMRDVLKKTKPDVVLVHGDTSTSTAVALAAFYQKIPVGHVEAGLRTHNIYSPWPEEMNRQLTGRIATYNFSPTELSKQNLLREGIDEKSIFVTGNTVIDALHTVVNKIKDNKDLNIELQKVLDQSGYVINRLNDGRKLVLITGHRRENFGDGFISICKSIKTLSEKYPKVDFVYPMHLNPNVRKPIRDVFGENFNKAANLFFIEPLEYLSFVFLMEKSSIVLTDSGGIQEEAPGLGKPVIVMRDTTERPEAVDAGTVKLVGTDYGKIVNEVSTLLDNEDAYKVMSHAVNPYGDGLACERIVNTLI
jgi:UDP-N-acetylglucosamine 2-epimerase (non-hydrolysing)